MMEETVCSSLIDALMHLCNHFQEDPMVPSPEGDPSIQVRKSADELMNKIKLDDCSKQDLQSVSCTIVWTAILSLLKEAPELTTATSSSSNDDDYDDFASALPSHIQRLLGALFCSCEYILDQDKVLYAESVRSLLNHTLKSHKHHILNLFKNYRSLFSYSYMFIRRIGKFSRKSATDLERILSPKIKHPMSGGDSEEDEVETPSNLMLPPTGGVRKASATTFKSVVAMPKSSILVRSSSEDSAAFLLSPRSLNRVSFSNASFLQQEKEESPLAPAPESEGRSGLMKSMSRISGGDFGKAAAQCDEVQPVETSKMLTKTSPEVTHSGRSPVQGEKSGKPVDDDVNHNSLSTTLVLPSKETSLEHEDEPEVEVLNNSSVTDATNEPEAAIKASSANITHRIEPAAPAVHRLQQPAQVLASSKSVGRYVSPPSPPKIEELRQETSASDEASESSRIALQRHSYKASAESNEKSLASKINATPPKVPVVRQNSAPVEPSSPKFNQIQLQRSYTSSNISRSVRSLQSERSDDSVIYLPKRAESFHGGSTLGNPVNITTRPITPLLKQQSFRPPLPSSTSLNESAFLSSFALDRTIISQPRQRSRFAIETNTIMEGFMEKRTETSGLYVKVYVIHHFKFTALYHVTNYEEILCFGGVAYRWIPYIQNI